MIGPKLVTSTAKHVWAAAILVATILAVAGCELPGSERVTLLATPTPVASPTITKSPPAAVTAVESTAVGASAERGATPSARPLASPSPPARPDVPQRQGETAKGSGATALRAATLSAEEVATARAQATVEAWPTRHAATATAVATVRAVATARAANTPDATFPHRKSACTTGRREMDRYGGDVVVRWAADGAHIFFTADAAVWAVTPDGSRLWRVAAAWRERYSQLFPGRMTSFDVTRDGKQVVFSTCRYVPSVPLIRLERLNRFDFDYELAVVGRDGQAPRRLTRHPAFDNYPAWSPDGTRVAFLSEGHVSEAEFRRGYRPAPGLHTMAADGADVRQLATGGTSVVWEPPAWSPDGRSIVVAVWSWNQGEEGHELYVVHADGSGYVRLAETVSGGAWSPDGTRLAFAKPEGAVVALYTIAADGADARRVTTIPQRDWIHNIAWSPDGSKLLYPCRPEQFCVVTRDGEPLRQLRLDGDRAVWSPDGARIAVTSQLTNPVQSWRRDEALLYTAAADSGDRQILAWQGQGLVAAQARGEDLATSRAACTAGFVVPAPYVNPGLVHDCKTLLAARAALFGGKLVNWGSGSPLAQWEGVTVTGTPPRVTTVALTGLEVAGPIPPVLGELDHLQRLYLPNNGFTGAIPPELGALRRLSKLSLRWNRLTGAIPAELGQLTNLTLLDLRRNDLSGAIPPELGQLQNLERLLLAENHLTGAIPPELGQLRKLERLLLAENHLTGAIPPELGALGQLIGLWLHRNGLTGPIPVELGQLARLRGLNLASNQLTGTIPPALVQLRYLGGPGLSRDAASNQWAGLFLDGNRLTGCIPVGLQRVPRNDLGYLNLPDCEAGA